MTQCPFCGSVRVGVYDDCYGCAECSAWRDADGQWHEWLCFICDESYFECRCYPDKRDEA